MLTEIIYDVVLFLSYILETTLPHEWDFCKLHLSDNIIMQINNGSYFIVYMAFAYWFMQYTLRRLKIFFHSGFQWKLRLLIYVISFSAAAQVFWPLFLLTTYFFTCSFYPWFTALTVVFLNFPPAFTPTLSKENSFQLYIPEYVGYLQEPHLESTDAQSTVSRNTTERAQQFILPIRRQPDARIFDRESGQVREDSVQQPNSTSEIHLSEPSIYRTEAYLHLNSEENAENSSSRRQEMTSSSFTPYYSLPPLVMHTSPETPPDRQEFQSSLSTISEQVSFREQDTASSSSTPFYSFSPPIMHSPYERPPDTSQFRSSLSTVLDKSPARVQEIGSYSSAPYYTFSPPAMHSSYDRPSDRSQFAGQSSREQDIRGQSSSASYNSFSPLNSAKEDEIHHVSTQVDIQGTSTGRKEMTTAGLNGHRIHEGLQDNIPLRRPFAELGRSYRTRSGYTYGPISH